MRSFFLIAFIAISGCATAPAAPSKESVQLAVWEITNDEDCQIGRFSFENQPQLLGVGLARWPSLREGKASRVDWHATGAQANVLLGGRGPEAACLSLHRRTRDFASVGPALFAAKVSASDARLTVERLPVTEGGPIEAAVLLVRDYGKGDVVARHTWSEGEASGPGHAEISAPLSVQRVNVLVAVAEHDFAYQLEAAVKIIQSVPIPDVNERPPRR